MVLVCNKFSFVFLKTRKTASTSVEMLFEPLCAPPGHAVTEQTRTLHSSYGIVGSRLRAPRAPWWDRLLRGEWRNHMPAETIRRRLGARRWNAMCRISTVRNPFGRTISHFHWRRRDRNFAGMDFAEIRAEFQSYIRSERWPDDSEVVLIDGRLVVDECIRFECLREDITSLIARRNLPIDPARLASAKAMPARRPAAADYFEQTDIDIVRRRFAWVFDHFDYPDRPDGQALPALMERAAP